MSEQQEIRLADFNPGVSEAIREILTPDWPSIQEVDFVRDWLPLFSNLTKEEEQTIDDFHTYRPMMIWVQQVAKKPNNYVNVMSGDTVIYQVPPLFRPLNFDFRDRVPGYDLYAEIRTAQMKAQILPAMGEAHLQDRVTSVILPKFVLDETAAKAWNTIFERYGMPTMPVAESAVSVQPETASTQEDADGPLTEL